MNENKDILKQLGTIAVGERLKRLGGKINNEIFKIYKGQNLEIEPGWLAVMHYLDENESASVLDIASALNFTHPAAIHFINRMMKKKLVEEFKHGHDNRKRMLKLSPEGKKQFEIAKPIVSEIEKTMNNAFAASGYDINHVVDLLEKILNGKSISQRTSEEIKKKMAESVEIIRFSPAHREQFKLLNVEWLEKYFSVEAEDERILNNPEEIIKSGGEIFFALVDGSAVGTCAVIRKSRSEFELAKMAVTQRAQGRQVGKKLALTAIGFAYSKGAKILSLESSRKLTTAVNLYESLGFEYVHQDQNSKYQRETFKMILELRK